MTCSYNSSCSPSPHPQHMGCIEQTLPSDWGIVRCSSHWGAQCESLQNGLGDVQTSGTTLALAYVLHHLSVA